MKALANASAALSKLPWPAELGIRLLVAALTPILVVLPAVVGVTSLTEVPEGTVLRVGGVDVTEQDMQARVRVMKALYGIQAPPEGDDRLDQFNRATARSIALTDVLDRAIAAHHLQVDDAVVRQTLDNTIRATYGPDGRDAFVKLLGEVGASEQDVLGEIRRQLGVARLFESVTKTVPAVTDEEIRQEYDRHRDQITAPEQRHLRNIVVDTEQRAEQVVADARAGTAFPELVSRYSLDRATRDHQGDLGFVGQDTLEDSYARHAFNAAEGTIFGPVRGARGWNVGQVLGIRAARPLGYDEAKESLRARMVSQCTAERWTEFINAELLRADVQYNHKYRPSAGETARAGETSVASNLNRGTG